jgi:PQQ-dependent catabolism-associated CXXCW motif protein
MTAGRIAAALIGLAILRGIAGAAESDSGTAVPEPPDYRLQDYRAPVPATLKGARVITTEEAASLWGEHRAIFVDVLPQTPRPRNLPAGTIWRDKPRFDIPGSIWLPDTGYGELAASMAGYLADNLSRLTQGDRTRSLVFYCLANCWMSWNAAKRALEFGYTDVAWYPGGTERWEQAGLPLAEAKPEPRPE